MNRSLLSVSILFCMLLPSCMQWHIGQRIRERGEIHTGADILHPVDGKLYRTPAMLKDDTALARVPEVTYCKRSPLVTILGEADGSRFAQKVTPTGQTRVVHMRCEEKYLCREHTPREFLNLAEDIPANAQAYPVAELGKLQAYKLESLHSYGSLTEPTKPSMARRLAAAPFDYLIDPALSATHTVVNVPFVIVAAPFVILWMSQNMHG